MGFLKAREPEDGKMATCTKVISSRASSRGKACLYAGMEAGPIQVNGSLVR